MRRIRFNIGENQRVLIIAGAAIVLILSVFIMGPLRKKTIFLQKSIKLAEAEIKEALTVQAKKDRVLEERDAYKKYLSDKKLDSQEIENNLLRELEKIAKSSKISIVNLSPAESTKHKKFHYADLRAEGTIVNILNFLGKLEKSLLLIKAERLRLSSKSRDAINLDLSAKLSVFTP